MGAEGQLAPAADSRQPTADSRSSSPHLPILPTEVRRAGGRRSRIALPFPGPMLTSDRQTELLRFALETAGVGAWRWDIRTDRVAWSDNLEAVNGLREGSFGGTFESFQAVIHADDRERFEAGIRAALDGGDTFELEFRIAAPGCGIRWSSSRGRVFRDEAGAPSYMVGVAQDVTERKEAELRLARSEEQLAEAQEIAQLGSWDWVVHTDELTWSRQTYRNFGVREEEYSPSLAGFLALVHAEDRAYVEGGIGAALRDGAPFQMEHRVVRPDGTVRVHHVRGRVVVDGSGAPVRMVGTSQDVTETREVEARVRQLERSEAARTEAEHLEALRSSEERFRTVVESLGEGILITDLDDRILYTNSRNCEITGYTRDELIGRVGYDLLLAPEEREPLRQRNAERAEGTAGRYAMQQVRPDGTRYWVEVQGNPIRDAAGRIVGTVGAISDITERRAMEESLRAAEAHYRRLVRTSPYAVYALDIAGRFTEINPAGERLLGRPAVEILGRAFAEVLEATDREPGLRHFRRVVDGERNDIEFEARVVRPDGEVRWIGVTATAIEDQGAIVGMHGIARDVTEERAARERLVESEQRFRQIADNVRPVFWMNDPAGQETIYVSRAFEEIWGRPCEWLHTGPHAWQSTIVEEDREAVRASFTAERLVSGEYDVEYRITRPNGEIRWIHDRAFPIRDEKGEVYRIAGLAEDITAQRVLETQLRTAQKMEAVGRLAGGIAHDFNNMLMAIIGHTQFMEEELPAASPLHEDLREIRRAADRSASLTQQLLAFSRKQILRPRSVDLNEHMRSMSTMLCRLIGEDIEMRTTLAPGLPPIYADPGQVEQVILNLVVNARDAMPDGGLLVLETRQVHLSAAYGVAHGVELTPGDYALLVVSDTGVGMDQQTQGHIFEPFFTTKEVGKGTGLGLSTVYGVVKQSGGFIWVYSEPERGTTFKIYLPLASRTDAVPAHPSAPAANPVGTETVLVVEDEPAVRMLVTRILGRSGYTVLEAADGAEAVRLAESHRTPIDLLLTDVIMPRMNGSVVAARVLAHQPGARVLFMSGYTDDAIAQHGVLGTGTQFLEKPFPPETLTQRVREVLDGTARARTPAAPLSPGR
jgi:two-component system, cell cycle sensor histidine kinase and response regulator CckA